nr:transcription factor SKN7-like isoform X2 [Manis javanica]
MRARSVVGGLGVGSARNGTLRRLVPPASAAHFRCPPCMLVPLASTAYFRCPPYFLPTVQSGAAEREASRQSRPVAHQCLPLTPSPLAASPPPPWPPPADIAVARQSPAQPTAAASRQLRGPPRQEPCALFPTQAGSPSGSSPSPWGTTSSL